MPRPITLLAGFALLATVSCGADDAADSAASTTSTTVGDPTGTTWVPAQTTAPPSATTQRAASDASHALLGPTPYPTSVPPADADRILGLLVDLDPDEVLAPAAECIILAVRGYPEVAATLDDDLRSTGAEHRLTAVQALARDCGIEVGYALGPPRVTPPQPEVAPTPPVVPG